MKKLIIISFIIVLILMAFVFLKLKLSDYEIRNHPENLIGKENFNTLFNLCKANIDTGIYPKNATSWQRFNNYNSDKLFLYENYDETFNLYLKKIELYKFLGDKADKSNKKSFSSNIYFKDNTKNATLYFDYNGNLMMINKHFNPKKRILIDCNYNKGGKLIEAQFSGDENTVQVFNRRKQLIFDYTVTHFGVDISNDYAPYILK